ncbi:MAG: phasin family protein [Pirellulales bacterium]|nr:phasin family protein [Pirellulales bacterium]
MYNATEQFSELNKANYQQAMRLATLGLENAEKLAKLSVEHARVAIEDGMKTAEAATTVKDFHDLMALRAKIAEAGVQKAVAYSRDVYEVAAKSQAEFASLVEATLAQYNQGMALWVEKAAQGAPAGSDVAVTALKSTVAATSAAIDQITKATKQVVNFADAGLRAASKTAEQAATQAAQSAVAAAAAAPKGRKVA